MENSRFDGSNHVFYGASASIKDSYIDWIVEGYDDKTNFTIPEMKRCTITQFHPISQNHFAVFKYLFLSCTYLNFSASIKDSYIDWIVEGYDERGGGRTGELVDADNIEVSNVTVCENEQYTDFYCPLFEARHVGCLSNRTGIKADYAILPKQNAYVLL